ncbi:hypothetical protein D3C71_1536760 [compost metagenome]
MEFIGPHVHGTHPARLAQQVLRDAGIGQCVAAVVDGVGARPQRKIAGLGIAELRVAGACSWPVGARATGGRQRRRVEDQVVAVQKVRHFVAVQPEGVAGVVGEDVVGQPARQARTQVCAGACVQADLVAHNGVVQHLGIDVGVVGLGV